MTEDFGFMAVKACKRWCDHHLHIFLEIWWCCRWFYSCRFWKMRSSSLKNRSVIGRRRWGDPFSYRTDSNLLLVTFDRNLDLNNSSLSTKLPQHTNHIETCSWTRERKSRRTRGTRSSLWSGWPSCWWLRNSPNSEAFVIRTLWVLIISLP